MKRQPKAKAAPAEKVYEIWLKAPHEQPECYYSTTIAAEVVAFHDGLTMWRSNAKEPLNSWDVEFVVLVDGKPVAIPLISEQDASDAWDVRWNELQSSSLTYFELFMFDNRKQRTSGDVCERHFELYDVAYSLVGRLKDGGGYMIRKREGEQGPLAIPPHESKAVQS